MRHVTQRSLLALGLMTLLSSPLPVLAQQAAPTAAPRIVLVRPVKLEQVAQERRLPGTIRPRVETDIAFRVAGKVIRRLVDAGQIVQAGDVLAEMDRTDLQLQLRQAEADRAAALSARDTTRAELERVTTLRHSGWSTQADLDRQKSAAEEAAGRLARADNAVSLARNALDYTILRADASGVIITAMAEPGQVLGIGQAAFRLAHIDRLEAEVAVPETLLEAARAGVAEVSLWALPGASFPASLREVSPRADPATRTYAARFALPDNAPGVTWGMTATVTLRAAGPRAVLLPLSAILDEGKGPTVFVLDPRDNTLSQRPVMVARFGTDAALVTGGLADGDMVVMLGVQKLVPGMPVRPVTRLPS